MQCARPAPVLQTHDSHVAAQPPKVHLRPGDSARPAVPQPLREQYQRQDYAAKTEPKQQTGGVVPGKQRDKWLPAALLQHDPVPGDVRRAAHPWPCKKGLGQGLVQA